MDKATLIGLGLAIVGVFVGLVMKGADPVMLFTNVAAMMIVGMGTMGAVFTGHSMSENKSALKALKKVFSSGPQQDPGIVIEKLVDYSNLVRRDGLISIESRAKDEPDPFFRRAMLLAIDGVDPQTIQATLSLQIKAIKERHKTTAGWFSSAGVYSPTFGIIGAVVGLIAVLGNLEDPEALGHGIAAAFVATFWGVFLANGLFLPWANKLKRLSAQEIGIKTLIVEGVLDLQAGMSPRIMTEQLESILPDSERKAS